MAKPIFHPPLKPLKSNSDRKIPGFTVCDVESTDWINFQAVGIAYKVYDEDDVCTKKHYEYFTNLTEFCDALFDESQPYDLVIAHFGGKFDFAFWINEMYHDREKYRIHEMLPRGSGLLCMSVSTFTRDEKPSDDCLEKTKDGFYLNPKRTIIFRDSSAMLPFSLKSLTKDFDVEHKKKDFDHTENKAITPELLKYMEWDHWGLYEVLEKYFRWPMIKNAGTAFTMASQALRVFRTFMKEPISSLSKDVDNFVRASYFGGRTEIFRPFFNQHEDSKLLMSFDVNSLYPAVMGELEFPTSYRFATNKYLENEMGFYDVEVTVPEMYVPPLGVKYEGMEERLIFPTGTFRGTWSTMELNYAVSLGARINKVYRGMIFKNGGKIFKDYIEYLYAIRKAAPKASVDNVLCKLLMNSTYGRFGLNLDREQLVFDYGQLGVIPHMDIETGRGNRIIRLSTKEVYLESSFTNVAVAAWVTSGARIWMHKLYNQASEDLYYTDTDSIKSTHSYPCNDDDLGQLKLEYRMKKAVYLLPKTYIEDTDSPIFKLYDVKGNILKDENTAKKLVLKGFDKKKAQDFTYEDFQLALEGDLARLRATNPKKFAPLKTAISHDKFLALIEETARQVRTRYSKRRMYKRPYAQVYDTEPLHIKHNEIVNLDKDILKKWKLPDIEVTRRIVYDTVAEVLRNMEETGGREYDTIQ